MSVHYKFKSALEFDTVTFDGLHISVGDLKKAILHQKKLSRNVDFDLQITNAQTKEVYTDESALIAKNTSLIVARVPLSAQQKRTWSRDNAAAQLVNKAGEQQSSSPADNQDGSHTRLAKAVDLASLDASEDDKIRAMMTQSTFDYDPSNYMRIKGASQMGEVPANYRCHKCHKNGHWIKNCPLIQAGGEPLDIKKSTGIPRSFMVPVSGPLVPGAMMTPTGDYAVPAIDHEAYKEQKKERPPFQAEGPVEEPKPELPEDLVCSVCKDLLTDAVMIPCCGTSFCDECIRGVLLDSDDHECPDCKEQDVSPDTLIPNRFLRNAVNNFRNETGYNKQPVKIVVVPARPAVPPTVPAQPVVPPDVPAQPSVPKPAAETAKPVSGAEGRTASQIPVLGAAQAPVPGSSPPYHREARPPPHLTRAIKDFTPRPEERADTPTHDEPGPPRLPDLTLPPPNFAPQPPPAPPGVEESYMVSGVPPSGHPMEYRPIESVVPALMQPLRYGGMPAEVPAQYTSRNYGGRGFEQPSAPYHLSRGVAYRGRRGAPRGMDSYPPRPCDEQPAPLHGGGSRGYRERDHAPVHNGKSADNIDTLEEFNRILRERDRKLRRPRRTRSYSRSPPRRGSPRGSYSPRSPSLGCVSTSARHRSPRSRTPRSRSPAPRSPVLRARTRSRSRSRSFSLSRSPSPREFSPRRQKQPLVTSPRFRLHSRSPPRFRPQPAAEYDEQFYPRGGNRHPPRKDERDFFPQSSSTESYRYQGDRFARPDKRFEARERKQAPLRPRYDARKETTERFERYEARSHFESRDLYEKPVEQVAAYYEEPEVPGTKPPSLLDIDLKMPPSLFQMAGGVEPTPAREVLRRDSRDKVVAPREHRRDVPKDKRHHKDTHRSHTPEQEEEPSKKLKEKEKKKKRRESEDKLKKKKHKEKASKSGDKKKTRKVAGKPKKPEVVVESAQLAEPDSSVPEPDKPEEPKPVADVVPQAADEQPEPAPPPVVIKEPEILVPLPEPSRWERDEPEPSKWEKSEESSSLEATPMSEKPQVTSEVLKRAENAIFKKAINAIRPERKDKERRKPDKKEEEPPVEVKPQVAVGVVAENPSQAPAEVPATEEVETRRSVKERLGVKVENKRERRRSHAHSPTRAHQSSRRRERSRDLQDSAQSAEVNVERRVVVEPPSSEPPRRVVITGKRKAEQPNVVVELETKKGRVEKSSKHRKKSTESKKKKEKRHHKKHKKKEPARRKSTLDEASFEPDYDASSANESEPQAANGGEEKTKRAKRKESSSEASESSSEESSSGSSSESSGESRKRSKRKKKKKSGKRRKRKSSSSGSESSSESEREKKSKKRRHKKKKKHHKQ